MYFFLFFLPWLLSGAACIGESSQSQRISSVQEVERGMTHLPAIVPHSHIRSKAHTHRAHTHTEHTHRALQALSLCVNSTLSAGEVEGGGAVEARGSR